MTSIEILIYGGFLYAFAGSLHCVGMCGPLITLMPNQSNTVISHILYHSGRILSYGFLGALAGFMGQNLILQDFRGSISLFAGMSIIALLLVSYFKGIKSFEIKLPWQKSIQKALRFILMNRNIDPIASSFAFGVLNGFLPCGLLYIALIAAAGTENLISGWVLLISFGIGTVPALSAVLFLRSRPLFSRFQKSGYGYLLALCVSLLLISRGSSFLLFDSSREEGYVCHTIPLTGSTAKVQERIK